MTNVTHCNYRIMQALDKLRKKIWRESHDKFNLCPSTRVTLKECIERVKDVVDAGDYFYYKHYGKFYEIPAF